MKKSTKIFRIYLTLFFCALATVAGAQIKGVVIDNTTGDPIPNATVTYKGLKIATLADIDGHYVIQRHNGADLTFSAVGYKPQVVHISPNIPSKMNVRLDGGVEELSAVVIKSKKKRYSRKNNPAVELMKRVIAAKKRNDLKNNDYYRYRKYQKITLAENDITPSDLLESKRFKGKDWVLNQVELCDINKKLILPLSVDETVSDYIYRKSPKAERTIIEGQRSNGINDIIQTGDILNVAIKDLFTDVDIYDDQVRLLQYQFTSPIGKNAIDFYRFYIQDTVKVDRDSCFHMAFIPNNQQDFGFRGDLWIVKDSTLHVKRCELSIPKRSDVNFVDDMKIVQEYTLLDNGEWVLTTDDMIVEMSLLDFLSKMVVIRTTRLGDYSFDEIPNKLFKGKTKEVQRPDAGMRDEKFWADNRAVELTKSEGRMKTFVKNLTETKGFKYLLFVARAFLENFVETGGKDKPSKVDIGPINTMISNNFIDGFRSRVSAQTTANFNKQLFFSGYYAHGWDSRKNYYKADVTYSFNKKDYLPREFPKRTISFTSTYDVMAPSDKFISTDKDNVFTAFKWTKVDEMMFYNRQQLSFEYEQEYGLKTSLFLKHEINEACGKLAFTPLAMPGVSKKLNTSEIKAEIFYSPGQTYINTKQRRTVFNKDAPEFSLSHTMGFKDFLGGDYKYNLTEARIYKRLFLNSWGYINCTLKAGAQWNTVPFPLLIMPAANLSFILQRETFSLINNMEFLNDRYASVNLGWNLNGKLFNRIPLLKHLKWREYIGFKCLWGKLTDKNNPAMNPNSSLLMQFPEGATIMDSHRPYMEVSFGIHNILKLFHVEYVRRLNYLDLPTAHKHGVRLMMQMTF